MRTKYEELMKHPEQIEAILQEGARKAREIAVPFMQKVGKPSDSEILLILVKCNVKPPKRKKFLYLF